MEELTATVATQISLYQVINALIRLSTTYPMERVAPYQIEQIERCAKVLRDRLEEKNETKTKAT